MTLQKEEHDREQLTEQELDSVLSTISHDLQTPLRHLRSFSTLLLESIESPDCDQLVYKGFIESSITKLESMIDATTRIARLSTSKEEAELIDTTALITGLVDKLSLAHDDSTATISIDADLPDIVGKPMQITQLFSCVIDNAFVHKNPAHALTLKIAADHKNGFSQFEITDNGIGINEQFHSSVFKLFNKLNTNKRPDAPGVGLTIAKKIVTLHGGEITLSSIENKGSSFFIAV